VDEEGISNRKFPPGNVNVANSQKTVLQLWELMVLSCGGVLVTDGADNWDEIAETTADDSESKGDVGESTQGY
jgi:hypothetical protein